ncbi:unnamed protein product [Brassica oleracea var. botrytis]|nr:unnamed protein product [Brassica napus]VDD49325.1 unnamed protein product [Brassica oleracea]
MVFLLVLCMSSLSGTRRICTCVYIRTALLSGGPHGACSSFIPTHQVFSTVSFGLLSCHGSTTITPAGHCHACLASETDDEPHRKPLTYPLQSPLPSVDLVVIASCGTGEIRLSSDISNTSPIRYTGFTDHSVEILASASPSVPHYLHLCRRDQADWYLEMRLHFSVMDLSSSVEFPLTIFVLILKRMCSTCQWISFRYKTSLFTRYGNIGVQSIISKTHPAMDLFHFSSDSFTSTSPQPLKPHLPVVVMIKAPTLSLIWRHRLHSSGFIKSTLTLPLRLHLVAGSTVQECGSARFVRYYITAAFPSHYVVSSIDGSSQCRIYDPPNLLIAETIVQECGLARTTNYITAAPPSHYAVSSIDGSSHSQLCNLLTGVVARRSNHHQAFYLLSDVCSHTFWLNECDDCMLRFLSVTNYWTRHGNVEFRSLGPIKPSARSSNFIPGASLEAKLELEIHLVSSISFVGFKAACACFIVISSQTCLRTLNVVYGSGASHLRLLPFNIPTSSYRCINVVFDYQLYFRTITMGTKVEHSFGFLRFAEHDSPLDGSIFSCFEMFSSFILPLNMSPGSFASVVNFYAL